MERSIQLLVVVIGVELSTLTAKAGELRTYRFVVDGSLPYTVGCGECGPSLLGARADIEGTFTVALNHEAGTGTLLELDDHLVNVLSWLSSPTGPVLEPADPAAWNFGIIPPWSPQWQPPLDGVLSSDGDTLRLISDGSRPNLDGIIVSLGPPFTIAMQGDEASFSMVVPIMDWFITVTDVPARIVEATFRGDYNGDGSVDAADYVALRKYGGIQSGYDTWRANFGTTIGGLASASTNAAIPEPISVVMALVGTLASVYRWRATTS